MTSEAPSRPLRVMMLDPSGSVAPFTHNLCNALVEHGCDVHLYTGPHWMRGIGKLKQHIYTSHVIFYRRTQLPAYDARDTWQAPFWNLARIIGHVIEMFKVMRAAEDFDIVHVQFSPVPWLDKIFLVQIARRRPVIITAHDTVPHGDVDAESWRARMKRLYATATHLIGHCEFSRRELQERFDIAEEKIAVIPLPALEHLLDLARNETQRPNTILFLGQLRANKGLDTLLEACALLKQSGKVFRLVVAGTSRLDVAPFQAQTEQLGISQDVEWHWHFLSEAEVAGWLRKATVVALPYRVVDQSGVAVAAVTIGRSVLGFDVGGLGDFIRAAKCGEAVAAADAGAFADALGPMLSDKTIRMTFEANGKAYAEKAINAESIARQTVALYRQLVSR